MHPIKYIHFVVWEHITRLELQRCTLRNSPWHQDLFLCTSRDIGLKPSLACFLALCPEDCLWDSQHPQIWWRRPVSSLHLFHGWFSCFSWQWLPCLCPWCSSPEWKCWATQVGTKILSRDLPGIHLIMLVQLLSHVSPQLHVIFYEDSSTYGHILGMGPSLQIRAIWFPEVQS